MFLLLGYNIKGSSSSQSELSQNTKSSLVDDLMLAVHLGDVQTVQDVLLEGLDDVDQFDELGYSALHYAVCYNHISLVLLLLKNGASANLGTLDKCTVAGVTPIHIATILGHAYCLTVLARSGGNVNAMDSCGLTPLHYCVDSGDAEIAKCLIALGADDTVCGDNGSALHHAGGAGNIVMIDLLVQAGCPLALQDSEGLTPAEWARRKGMDGAVFYLEELQSIHLERWENRGGMFVRY